MLSVENFAIHFMLTEYYACVMLNGKFLNFKSLDRKLKNDKLKKYMEKVMLELYDIFHSTSIDCNNFRNIYKLNVQSIVAQVKSKIL